MSSRIKPAEIETAIHRITVEEARLIRGQILTAGTVTGSIVYFGDDEADTLHVGALIGSQLAAIASVCCESMLASSESGQWRLRGMATVPEFRGKGLGTRLLERCIAHVAEKHGSLIWCTARRLRFTAPSALRKMVASFDFQSTVTKSTS
jgi:GNAT superfamily N-acetyltransferase